MASRFGGKTYGRRSKTDKSSSAFDEAVKETRPGDSKATSAQAKWGKTSLASARAGVGDGGGETEVRKRHAEDDADRGLFDDPFGFDSDDEGPSKPKRGMGFKAEEQGVKQRGRGYQKSSGSKRLKKDENNEERDTMKRAPTRTYSRGSRMANDATAARSKQLSIDAFTAKLSSNRDNNKVQKSSRQTQPKANKFFTSKNKHSAIEEKHTFMFSDAIEEKQDDNDIKETDSRDESEFEYNSDDLANLDSGDPEIIFNSPQKRRRAAKNQEASDTTKAETEAKVKPAVKPEKNSATSRLFADSDGSDNDTDSAPSSQPPSQGYGMKASRTVKAKSMDPSLSPSRFFPELSRADRAGSADSSGADSAEGGARPRKALSLSSKLLSLEAERKQKKQGGVPLVRRLLTSPKKAKAMYNPRQWHGDAEEGASSSQSSGATGKKGAFDADFDDDAPPAPPPLRMRGDPKLRRVTSEGSTPWDDDVTKVNINRSHKPYYQVVRHVKQAHECQESGETQDFKDELSYIMEGLHSSQSVAVRSLSCLSLAQKCTASSFRMHLRAHGVLDKAFHQLQDAHQYPVLALCTAAVMFLVSRDRFTMDLEKETLELMLRVLSVKDPEHSPQKQDKEYVRMQGKMRAICDSVKLKGRSTLDVDQVTTGQLAMESLLTFTCKKAGDWFKDDMRVLGGLDHIVNTVGECAEDVDSLLIDPSDDALDQIRKIERCLRVLENVTYMNSENQNHLISYQSCSLIKSLLRVLKSCENCLSLNPVEEVAGKINKDSCGYITFNCLLASLRVLLNLTHDNEYGSTKVGMLPGLVNNVLLVLLRVPQYVPADQRFDLLVLGLGLLINMVEHCEHNRDVLLTAHAVCPYDEFSPLSRQPVTMDTLEALTKLFLIRYEAARRIEIEHDEEMEKREQALAGQKQKRLTAGLNNTAPASDDPNASGVWRESDSGLEWIANEDQDKEKRVAVRTDDSDLDVDGEVMPGSQDEEENFTKALHKAGRHMEDCILAAYVALLIGCTIQGNTEHIERVRDVLPEGDFEPMCRMLRKFLGFMNFTATEAVSQSSGSKSISRIIEVLDAC